MAGRYKYCFREPLKNIPKDTARAYLDKEVFTTSAFQKHIDQVSYNLKVNPEIVRDVLEHYFTHVFFILNTTRKIKTKINLYGFFSLSVLKGDRF